MKELYTYICENIFQPIFEGGFTSKDWIKHDYKYVQNVIKSILDNDEITLIDKKTNKPCKPLKLSLTPKQKESLQKIGKNPKDHTIQEFEQILEISWSDIYKIPFSIGDRVKTADQELATCLVFNSIAETVVDIENDVNIESLVRQISDNFDKAWIKTFKAQSKFICQLIESLQKKDKNVKLGNFRLRRYGEKNISIQEQQDVVNKYAAFVQQYTQKNGQTQKDIYDPSDVLLIDTTKCSDIINALNTLINDLDNKSIADVRNDFQKVFYGGISEYNEGCGLYGISLKKLNVKDDQIQGSIGIVNMADVVKDKTSTKDLETKEIKVNDIKNVTISGTGLSFVLDLTGQFNLEDLYFDNKKHKQQTECTFTIRSGGDDRCGVDVRFSHNEPSMGKCPIALFKKLFSIQDYTENKVQNIINAVKEQYDTAIAENNKEPFIEKLTLCVQAAIKRQPNCLPFIVIH